jgi:hypothetical protein
MSWPHVLTPAAAAQVSVFPVDSVLLDARASYDQNGEEQGAMQNYVETAEKIGIPKGLITPRDDEIDAEAARFILSLGFSAETQQRIQELLKKNREEELTPEEQEELDRYLKSDNHLAILKLKARLSLTRAGLKL